MNYSTNFYATKYIVWSRCCVFLMHNSTTWSIPSSIYQHANVEHGNDTAGKLHGCLWKRAPHIWRLWYNHTFPLLYRQERVMSWVARRSTAVINHFHSNHSTLRETTRPQLRQNYTGNRLQDCMHTTNTLLFYSLLFLSYFFYKNPGDFEALRPYSTLQRNKKCCQKGYTLLAEQAKVNLCTAVNHNN